MTIDADLGAVLEASLTFLGTYLLHSSALLLFVWLFHLVSRRFRESPFLVEHAWKGAAIAGLLTAPAAHLAGVASPAFVLTVAPPGDAGVRAGAGGRERVDGSSRDARVVIGAHAALHGRDPIEDGPVAVVLEDPPGASRSFDPTSETAAAPRAGNGTRAWLPPFGAVLALTTIALGLARLVLQTRRFERTLGGCRELSEGPARALLEELVENGGGRSARRARRVILLEASGPVEPAAFGLWRGRILLPRGIETDLPPEELRALLAHELAHLVRGDPWWLLAGRFLCTCFPFQPLNFLARREWQRAVELDCDDRATRQGVDRLTLARCLTRVAEWRLEHRDPRADLALAATRSRLAERVERLVGALPAGDPWASRRRKSVLAAAALALAAGLTSFGPRLQVEADVVAGIAARTVRSPAITPLDASNVVPRRPADDRESEPDDAPGAGLARAVAELDRELDLLDEETRSLTDRLARASGRGGARSLLERIETRMESLQRKRRLLASALARAAHEPPSNDKGDSP